MLDGYTFALLPQRTHRRSQIICISAGGAVTSHSRLHGGAVTNSGSGSRSPHVPPPTLATYSPTRTNGTRPKSPPTSPPTSSYVPLRLRRSSPRGQLGERVGARTVRSLSLPLFPITNCIHSMMTGPPPLFSTSLALQQQDFLALSFFRPVNYTSDNEPNSLSSLPCYMCPL